MGRRFSTRIVARSCWPVGTKITTKFDGVSYVGEVSKILPPTREDQQLWHVTYDDGNEADLDRKEMKLTRDLYLDEMVDVDSIDDDDEVIEYKMFSSSSEDECDS